MKALNNKKINELSKNVIDAITEVKANYNLSWSKFKCNVNEIIAKMPYCGIKILNDHNQWRKIYNGEIGSSYSYDWWITLQSIIEALPDHIDKKGTNLKSGLEVPSKESSFLTDLNRLGIIGTSNNLSESKFKPIQCMKETESSLFFMGILGSKWVKDKETFREFLIKIQSKPNGSVRYLMINPFSESFRVLKSMRGEHLKDVSTNVFKELVAEFPCLQARYYSFIPSFRLIFIDSKLAAVSRYKLDKNKYIESKQGWEAPHLIIQAEGCNWSLYEPFLSYYQYIWENATDINKLRGRK